MASSTWLYSYFGQFITTCSFAQQHCGAVIKAKVCCCDKENNLAKFIHQTLPKSTLQKYFIATAWRPVLHSEPNVIDLSTDSETGFGKKSETSFANRLRPTWSWSSVIRWSRKVLWTFSLKWSCTNFVYRLPAHCFWHYGNWSVTW